MTKGKKATCDRCNTEHLKRHMVPVGVYWTDEQDTLLCMVCYEEAQREMDEARDAVFMEGYM